MVAMATNQHLWVKNVIPHVKNSLLCDLGKRLCDLGKVSKYLSWKRAMVRKLRSKGTKVEISTKVSKDVVTCGYKKMYKTCKKMRKTVRRPRRTWKEKRRGTKEVEEPC